MFDIKKNSIIEIKDMIAIISMPCVAHCWYVMALLSESSMFCSYSNPWAGQKIQVNEDVPVLPNSHCEPCNIDHTWHGKIAMMFKDNNKHAKISPPNLLPEISF